MIDLKLLKPLKHLGINSTPQFNSLLAMATSKHQYEVQKQANESSTFL